ncbi:hypothetical protein D3C80_2139610 [compost metagenome]
MNACTEFFYFSFDFLNIAEVVRFFLLESQEFLFGFTQFGAAAAGQRNPSGMG